MDYDYAKRAAELVQCEKNNGYWLTCIDGRYLADGHGENAADVTGQIRAWLAAELRAAHDAGVAERDAEVATLRQIICDAARECGGLMSPECSLEFVALLPREIALATRRAKENG